MQSPRHFGRFVFIGLLVVCVVASIGCPPSESTQENDPVDSEQSSSSSASNENVSSTENGRAVNGSAGDLGSSETNTEQANGSNESDHSDDEGQEPAYQEPIFVDWTKPDVALFITGRQNGYIEPCGCTGLANQKGGLLRRHSLMKQLQAQDWQLVPFDLGNQIRRFGMQPVIKFSRTFEILTQHLDYQAIGLGPDDLRLDAIEIFSTVVNFQGDFNPLVSANVQVLEELVTPYRVIEAEGLKIGVTSVLGDNHAATVRNIDVTFLSSEEGLGNVVPELLRERCDFYVLLCYAPMKDCEAIAERFPDFDLIVTAGGDGEPTREPQTIQSGNHTTQIIQTGYKGMHVGVVGLWKEDDLQLRYQRVPLDSRFEDSDEVKVVFKEYQEQLKTLGLKGLDLNPVNHPSSRSFVGSDTCGECHTVAYDIWMNGVDGNGGPHYHATVSLTDPGERTWVQRHFDPECLSCHVTGWNPQKYYPYEGGYLDLESSSHLHGNGCENCHGPGSEHVEAEYGEVVLSDDEVLERQLGMRVTLEEAKKNLCMECHDLDNSPDFHVEGAWDKYWPQIEHVGVD